MERKAGLFRRGTFEEKLYHVWYNMRDRCYNKEHPAYYRYGGRGITVCPEWNNFRTFLSWANQAYKPGLWLDREDCAKNYEPANCRWITPNQSRDNTPKTIRATAFGETKTVAEWSRDPRCVVRADTLRARIRNGFPAELSITSPVGYVKWPMKQRPNN